MWRRLGGSLAVVLLAGAVVLVAVRTVALAGPGFQSNGPRIVAKDAGRAFFTGRPLAPGETRTRCVVVTNRGRGAGALALYGHTQGSGLDRYLRLRVVQGRGTCRSFRLGRTVFNGTLRAFPDDGPAAVRLGPTPPGESRPFRFRVTLGTNPAEQGLTAGQSFVWLATTP
jgi:hypothetical protein